MSECIPAPEVADEDLSGAEQQMLAAAITGTLIDLRAGTASDDHPAQATSWDTSRQIRATLLAEVLTGRRTGGKTPRAVKLRGARITGLLDLEASTVACPLLLWDCYLDEWVNLSEAVAPSIRMPGCHLSAFIAPQLRTTGDVSLASGFSVQHGVDLSGAQIGGYLDLSGASVVNDDGPALIADGLSVSLGMSCQDGFTARGEIRLIGGRIGGIFSFIGANLGNDNGPAVRADGLTADHLLFRDGFTAQGEIRLVSARIAGQFDLTGANLASYDGRPALTAVGLTVGQSMHCDEGFAALGEVRLSSARIGGSLSFTAASLVNKDGPALTADRLTVLDVVCQDGFTAQGEIRLPGSHIAGNLNLNGAKLDNEGGRALYAELLSVDQQVLCQERFSANGEVDLCGARIGGKFDLTGASLHNNNGPALTATRLTVGQDMLCQEGFNAQGAVSLHGAHISGLLSFEGARLASDKDPALDADRLTVDNGMFCGHGFNVHGEVRLSAARIGGQLDLTGARLENPKGRALSAGFLTVDHDMYCRNDFTAHGEIRLDCAHIGGQLAFTSAVLTGTRTESTPIITDETRHGPALTGNGLNVGEDMLCQQGFRAEGEMRLTGARIGGQLDLTGASLDNPDGTALTLDTGSAAALMLLPKQQPQGAVSLIDSKVVRFADDPSTWPQPTHLRGFVYDILANDQVSVRERLHWLARDTHGYVPQVYDQLATAYRNAGRDDAARRVAIAKQRRRRHAFNPLSWLWYATVGYGYRTWLAGVWLAALLAAGTWLFSQAHMIATVAHPPMFNAFAYTADIVLPIVDLGQKNAWDPEGAALYWSWALTGAGWILTTAVVAALSGVLKHD